MAADVAAARTPLRTFFRGFIKALMLDFIWHLRGSVELPRSTTHTAALDILEQMLKKQRKPVTSRTTRGMIFDDPLWRAPFGPNWLSMAIYDKGHF